MNTYHAGRSSPLGRAACGCAGLPDFYVRSTFFVFTLDGTQDDVCNILTPSSIALLGSVLNVGFGNVRSQSCPMPQSIGGVCHV